MAEKARYLPPLDGGKVTWLNTFSAGVSSPDPTLVFPTLGELLGLTAAEVTSIAADALMFSFCVQNLDDFVGEKVNRTKYKDLVRSGPVSSPITPYPSIPVVTPPPAVAPDVFGRVSGYVSRIKASPNYNVGIGGNLGIIGAEQINDPTLLKPILTLQARTTGVFIGWKKQFADAIKFYVDRGAGYVFLAIDTEPDYLDTFALPSIATVWKYKAVYLIKDEEVGLFSDETVITVRSTL